MIKFSRAKENPILAPDPKSPWEAEAAFNGSVAFDGEKYHMVYRALSREQDIKGARLKVSSIGCADSDDGVHFSNRRQLVAPTEDWEKFGCEDPRVTKLGDIYYIFYTALSQFPFGPGGIKVAVALTRDFQTIEAKHLVTPFNAKAMSMFPELINGKIVCLLTAHTDMPPARVCLAEFDAVEQIWSPKFWQAWHDDLEDHAIFLKRRNHDHVEAGAPPVKTSHGWLLVFSYIQNYFAPPPTFGVEAVLLDLKNPRRIIGRTLEPIFKPAADYELKGQVPNIVFPTGAVLQGDDLKIYYGAADTSCCLASLGLEGLAKDMLDSGAPIIKLRRSGKNPILTAIAGHAWESKAVYNPAAIYASGQIHLLYRAQSDDNTSVFGYARLADGVSVSERLLVPVYLPRAEFEQKLNPGGNSGCEDPRLTVIDETVYMTYTAYDGKHPPRVALSTISLKNFLDKKWNWSPPKLISPPGVDDKDSAIFPKKFGGKFAVLHRTGESIFLDFKDNLDFSGGTWLDGKILFSPRPGMWDSIRIGTAAPPIETPAGWLLLYHGISEHHKYRVGAALLDLKNPKKVLVRTDEPIFEPEMPYEQGGQVPQVVFPCGAAVIGETLYVYYGAADSCVGVAKVGLQEILG